MATANRLHEIWDLHDALRLVYQDGPCHRIEGINGRGIALSGVVPSAFLRRFNDARDIIVMSRRPKESSSTYAIGLYRNVNAETLQPVHAFRATRNEVEVLDGRPGKLLPLPEATIKSLRQAAEAASYHDLDTIARHATALARLVRLEG